MSGGSYQYAYVRLENDFLYEFERRADTPERKAFLTLLRKVAKAMRDIEWVDSGDCSPGNENDAIRAALGEHWKKACLDELISEASDLCKTIRIYINNSKL